MYAGLLEYSTSKVVSSKGRTFFKSEDGRLVKIDESCRASWIAITEARPLAFSFRQRTFDKADQSHCRTRQRNYFRLGKCLDNMHFNTGFLFLLPLFTREQSPSSKTQMALFMPCQCFACQKLVCTYQPSPAFSHLSF